MILTTAQILSSLLCLGLPTRTDATFAFGGDREALRQAEVATLALQNLNADQANMAIAILAQWTAIQFDTDILSAQGLQSNSARTRMLLCKQMADTIGFRPEGGLNSISLMRG